MKKFMKVTQGKRFLSLILAVVMMATVFNMALPVLKLDASAQGETIDGVSQTRVVGTDGSYATTYEKYAAQYLNGASQPTNIVIPGLDPAQDYVIQGMTYYPKKDWMLVTAYHNADTDNGETVQSSKVFALDAATGDFVAMISFLNSDGSENTEHGGGIAISEHNLYYACGDTDRDIAYVSLDELDKIQPGEHAKIKLAGRHTFVEVGSVSSDNKTAYTAYVCYDEGILWTGNFFDPGADLIGITIAAAEYNAPSNDTYHSMVFGYKLSGSSSAEEWANLTGAKGVDCQGSPSYAIGLNNAIKDVQYAVVDNGKLYLSRSYGSGAGNSVSFGFGETSLLSVADIDLSVPGTVPVQISTQSTGSLDKTIMVHDISAPKDYEMMPMSEGLCFIDDQLFITFEGASNKYLNESSGLTSIGNCEKPIDVIWQLDPYDLVDVEKPAQEKSMYYERINSLNDIKNGEEYIILFESAEEDAVTQNNILYAVNSNGNFNGQKLSKGKLNSSVGYDGMIGHRITEYSIETDANGVERLYLANPEKDDTTSVRWLIDKVNDTNYKIKSTDTYFANYKNFYVDEDKITMAPDNASYISDLSISQLQGENGYFYISSKNGQNFLWCNDGTDEQLNDKADAYYSTKYPTSSGYSSITEVAGTFHCNATNSPILGGSVPVAKDDYPGIDYPDRAFKIYRREFDAAGSTYESRVYSNLDTKLEADGTYTVTFDTYAISPNHYQYVGERPTDYIIVADTSNSMNVGKGTGITGFGASDVLRVNSLTNEADTAGDRGKGINGYNFYNSTFDIRYKHKEDGKFYKMYLAINTTELSQVAGIVSKIKQYYFLYYIADDGKYYCFSEQSNEPNFICTEEEFKNWVANPEKANGYPYQTASSTKTANGNRQDEALFTGEHYRFDNINSKETSSQKNIDTLKTVTKNLVDQIAAQNSENRIALVQYGASNGFYNKNGTFTTSDYANAFWETSSKETLKNTISGLSTDNQGDNSGIELTYANNIISNSGVNYKADGGRNVAVIFLSDGIPGKETTEYNRDCDNNITGIKSVTMNETDANNAATQVIATAKGMKERGAFIYTVLFGNNSAGNFKKKVYMDAVSTKYPAAASMEELGGESVDGVTYALNLATASYDYFNNFGSIACKEVAVNSAVGLDNLDVNSYLRGVLSDTLIIPDDYSLETKFVPGEYDEIGRFVFGTAYNTSDETTDVKTVIDKDKKTITVTGYDYSEQYISRYNDGKALRIILKGLLADETKNLDNAIVSINEKTGIYKNKGNMDADEAFRNLSSGRINIPKYTYVLDYGLDLLDTDVNGTLKAVSAGLTKQDVNNYIRESEDGLVKINENDLDLLYHTTPTNTTDSGYVLIQRDDGSYDWFEIEVVPASNVYFEETEFATTSGTGTVAWSTAAGGTSVAHRELPDELDVDGYDEAYNNTNTYSNGKTLSATVDASNKRSKTATVTFTGDGIDLISACGPTTGLQIINIKDKETGKSVKASIVDTYYAGDSFSQVPIFSFRGENGTYIVETTAVYLTTSGAVIAGGGSKSGIKNNLIDTGLVMNSSENLNTAEVQAMLDAAGVEDVDAENLELVWFDDNSVLNGGTGVAPTKKGTRAETSTVTLENYLDGFRIYNPLGATSENYTASEQNASYVNVINNLAPVGDGIDSLDGIGFVTGSLADGEKLSFSNYESVGPTDELYLLGGKAITFKADINKGEKVMLGLRAVKGATTLNITSNKTDKNVAVTVNSATEMYYDITNCIGEIATDGTEVQIIVQNTGSNMLAVNQIKFSGGATVNTGNGNAPVTRSLSRSGEATEVYSNIFLPLTAEALVEVENGLTVKETVQGVIENGVILPVVEEEEEIPGDNTTPDVPEDDNTNDDTNTDSGETENFSIFSLLELLISLIEKILHSAFGTGNLF